MTFGELFAQVMTEHPAPWELVYDNEVIKDANGQIVVADGTCFLAFNEKVGAVIVGLVNAHAEALSKTSPEQSQ